MSRLRRWWTLLRHPHVHIHFLGSVYLGPGFSIHAPNGGTLVVGDGVEFRRGFRLELAGPDSRVEIGRGSVFTYDSIIQCAGTVRIGEPGDVGQSSMLVDGNHRFRDLTKPMLEQGYDLRPIEIGDDVTTTTKCTIMADIGTRAFVGANSVVTRDIPPYTVAAGVPARVIDYFGPPGMEPDGWESSTSRSERSG